MSLRTTIARLFRRGGTVFVGTPLGTTSIGTGLVDSPHNYERMLRAHIGWVYKAVQRRAQDLAACDPVVQEKRGQDQFVTVDDAHPLASLLRRPNPLETGFEFRWRLQQIADLTGNAYVMKVPNLAGTKTVELWVLDTRCVRIVTDNDGLIQRYDYQMGTRTWSLDPKLVMHLRYPNPRSLIHGLSPLAAAAYEVDIDLLAKDHQRQFLKNNPSSRMVIEAEGMLLPETVQRLRESIMQHQMSGNQGAPIVSQQGAKIKSLALAPQEINYLATRENIRDEILSIYGVPSSILGISKDVNRANEEAKHYSYALYTLEPLARLRDEVFTVGLALEFGTNLVITHKSLVPSNRVEDREDSKMLLDAGVTSVNEEREYRGWKPVAGGDEPTLPAGRIPLSQIGTDPIPAPVKAAGPLEVKDNTHVPGTWRWIHANCMESADLKTRGAARKAYWDEYCALHIAEEKRMVRALKRFFAAQATEVTRRLRAYAERNDMKALLPRNERGGDALHLDEIVFDQEEWNDALVELGFVETARSLPAAWEWAVKNLGRSAAFDMTREAVRRVMKSSVEKMKDVNVTTRDTLVDSIQQGIEANETTDQLAERVAGVYEAAAGHRAIRIARTLATQATNSGIELGWHANADLVDKKGWLSARDAHVRAPGKNSRYDHASPDGQEVDLNSPFQISGEELQFPGDPKGSPGNIIHCRCTMYPVLKKKKQEEDNGSDA
jgi:HK97 family phage portal protein